MGTNERAGKAAEKSNRNSRTVPIAGAAETTTAQYVGRRNDSIVSGTKNDNTTPYRQSSTAWEKRGNV